MQPMRPPPPPPPHAAGTHHYIIVIVGVVGLESARASHRVHGHAEELLSEFGSELFPLHGKIGSLRFEVLHLLLGYSSVLKYNRLTVIHRL